MQAQGGFTTVTGTITGAADGLVWSCGSISAQLVTAGGVAPTLNGGSFTTQTSPVGLGCPTTPGSGANGSFAMRLADSGVIVPSTTTWRFTVNMTPGIAPPAGTGPQSFTFTTAINCSTNTPSTCTSNTIDISSQLSALAPRLSNSGAGSGTVAEPLANGKFAVSNQCSLVVINCIFSPANLQVDNTATWSTATNIITITDGKFTAADVGSSKIAWGYGTTALSLASTNIGGCNPYQPQPVPIYITLTHLTITSFIDSNHITVSANPAVTESVTGQGCFMWGTPDDSFLAAGWTAINAATSCPIVDIMAGNYTLTTPAQMFYGIPAACPQLPFQYPYGATATGLINMLYSAGYRVVGRGRGATAMFWSPDYNLSGCNFGYSNTACMATAPGGEIENISVTQGGIIGNGTPDTTHAVIDSGVGSLYNVSLAAINIANGFSLHAWNQSWDLESNAAGAFNAFDIGSDTGGVGGSPPFPFATCIRCQADNHLMGYGFHLENNAIWDCQYCKDTGSQGNTVSGNQGFTIGFVTGTNAQLTLTGGGCFEQNSFTGITINKLACGSFGSGSTVNVNKFITNGYNSSVTLSDGFACAAACTIIARDVILQAAGTGTPLQLAAGSFLYNLGHNNFWLGQTGSTAPTNAGTTFPYAQETISGTCAGNAASVGSGLATYSVAPQTQISDNTSGDTAQVTAVAVAAGTATATVHCSGATDAFTLTFLHRF